MIDAVLEREIPRHVRSSQGHDAFGACADDAERSDVVDVGRRDSFGGRGELAELREGRRVVFAESGDEASRQRGRRLDGHLLADDRAHAHLEAVERPGYADAWHSLDEWRQARVLAELPGDQIGASIEIEEIAHSAQYGG